MNVYDLIAHMLCPFYSGMGLVQRQDKETKTVRRISAAECQRLRLLTETLSVLANDRSTKQTLTLDFRVFSLRETTET